MSSASSEQPTAQPDQTVEDDTDRQNQTARIDELEETVEAALAIAKRAQRKEAETREELTSRIEELETNNEQLRRDLDEVRERTDLLQAAKNASALKVDERAAVVIQNAVNQAAARDPPKASLDATEGLAALGGGIDRTSVYDVFRKAEELVDDDNVVWYQQEARGAAKNSRLIVDLENGVVPSTIAGHDISHGGE